MLWTLLACGASNPAPHAITEGAVCPTLEQVSVADPWSLPGTDEPGATDQHRTRVLTARPPWATRCVVQRLAGMDVGASCARSGATKADAEALFRSLAEDFRTCHAGWSLAEEADATTRDLVAERAGDLRFLRLRDTGEGWEVSVGAMPPG